MLGDSSAAVNIPAIRESGRPDGPTNDPARRASARQSILSSYSPVNLNRQLLAIREVRQTGGGTWIPGLRAGA